MVDSPLVQLFSFSKPMLKELTAEGDAAFEVALHYTGDIRIHIATSAIIPTGFGFKPYEISLELMVVVKAIHGNVSVRIKKPPSNRIWWGFTTMPTMDLRVLPVVSDRKIQVNMVLKAIEKQIRDAVSDSVVLPNMDDLAFFDTRHLRTRGGIFDEAGKHNPEDGVTIKADVGPDGLEPIPVPTSRSATPNANRPISGGEIGASPETSNLMAVQPSMAAEALDIQEPGTSDFDPETRSIGGNSTTSSLKTISDNTRRWLSNKGPEQLRHGASSLDSQSTLDSHNHGSSSPSRGLIEKTSNGFELKPSEAVTSTDALGAPVDPTTAAGAQGLDSPFDKYDVSKAKTDLLPPDRLSLLSETANSEASDPSINGSSNTASLMSQFRAKTADKKALQNSVNEARDVMRKWGKNWAAKRNASKPLYATDPMLGQDEEQLSKKLRAVEQELGDMMPDDHSDNSAKLTSPLSASAESPTSRSPASTSSSFQARLALAASQASASPSGPSSSTTARGSMDSSGTYRFSGDPLDAVSSRESDHHHHHHPPVRNQPSGTSAMAVPRIPRRPMDQVTSISSAGSSSSPENHLREQPDSVKRAPPPLPSRRTKDAKAEKSPRKPVPNIESEDKVVVVTSPGGRTTDNPFDRDQHGGSMHREPPTELDKQGAPLVETSLSRRSTPRPVASSQPAMVPPPLPKRTVTPNKTAHGALRDLVEADQKSRAQAETALAVETEHKNDGLGNKSSDQNTSERDRFL